MLNPWTESPSFHSPLGQAGEKWRAHFKLSRKKRQLAKKTLSERI